MWQSRIDKLYKIIKAKVDNDKIDTETKSSKSIKKLLRYMQGC